MEFEYEVTFMGSQWTAKVICYHELDSEIVKNRTAIEGWAEAVASNNGLELNDYHEVLILKTGELR